MRTFLLLVTLAAAAPQAAFALSATDKVADWAQASQADRTGAIEDWQRRNGKTDGVSRDDIRDCINEAAGVGGHGGFSIGDIADACAEQLRSRVVPDQKV